MSKLEVLELLSEIFDGEKVRVNEFDGECGPYSYAVDYDRVMDTLGALIAKEKQVQHEERTNALADQNVRDQRNA